MLLSKMSLLLFFLDSVDAKLVYFGEKALYVNGRVETCHLNPLLYARERMYLKS